MTAGDGEENYEILSSNFLPLHKMLNILLCLLFLISRLNVLETTEKNQKKGKE